MKVNIHDENGMIIESPVLDVNEGNYGYHIPVCEWHSVEVLESGTVIFDAKEGPYASLVPEDTK